MRILHVCDFIDPETGGGTAERTFQMSRALVRAGVECSVLTTDMGLSDERRRALGDVDLHEASYVCRRYVVPLVSPRRVRELVAQADVVHAMGHWSVLNAMACSAARRLGKPYVVCPAGSLEIFGRSGALKRLFNAVVGRRMVLGAARCFAVTELETEQFLKYGVGKDRIVIVPNGIDTETTAIATESEVAAFRARHRLGQAPFILFLGRLALIKGPDLLLEAFLRIAERFPNYQLVFAGSDEGMKSGMEQRLVGAACSDRVHFIGYVGGAEKSSAYVAADLLAVPSRREAMSLVALEAGFAGSPVLLTDRCGFDEVATIGAGAVCAPTADGIAQCLAGLLEHPERFPEMGARLQRHVNAHYTWHSITERCIGIYKSLCGRV
jgi:glycosyltransferase involved in cell wall biosynthesis